MSGQGLLSPKQRFGSVKILEGGNISGLVCAFEQERRKTQATHKQKQWRGKVGSSIPK